MSIDLPSDVTITYTQQFRRCGKPSCQLCGSAGRGHGPYWYAYWRENGRTRSRYLGKDTPAGAIPTQVRQNDADTVLSTVAQTTASLRVKTLGNFMLWRDDQCMDVQRWERQKIGTLCKWLLSTPGHRLTRDEVVERFWPDGEPEQGMANLRVLIHRLRRVLDSPQENHSYLHYDGEVLTLVPDVPDTSEWLDAETFERQAQAAMAGHDAGACRSALLLYTGDYLPGDAYEEWALVRREELSQKRIRLLMHQGTLCSMLGDVEEAEACLRAVLAIDPCHEEAVQTLMRLTSAAGRPGQALRLYRKFAEALYDDLALEPEAETQALARALVGESAIAPTIPMPNLAPNNLPVPMTSFIGRRRELADLRRLLRNGQTGDTGTPSIAQYQATTQPPFPNGRGGDAETLQCRLLTLTGPGGVGKTRLALQLADLLIDEAHTYPDGVWLIELASLADSSLVLKAIAVTLGVEEQDPNHLLDALTIYLKVKRLVLVLDNCEHLLDACATLVTALLTACPGLKILATSRASLGVSGEQAWPVPSLSLPDQDSGRHRGHLLGAEAVRLFLQRSRIQRPDLTITDDNADAVIRICRHLDGIPLALELAAARVTVLSLEQIAARLQESFQLLTVGKRQGPRRQQTLRATLDWSYNLLSIPERILFCRLSIFAGGCTLEAVEAVCGGDSITGDEVLDLLESLVRQSLVQVDEAAGVARYRLLETVRQYAWEQLTASGERTTLEERHASFYLAFVEEAEPELKGSHQALWLSRLEREHDNLRAVLRRSQKQGDTRGGLRLAGALWRFWEIRGYVSEGRTWLEGLLSQTRTVETGSEASAIRAKALNGAGNLAYAQDDYARAQHYYENGLALYTALDDQQGISHALGNLGNIAYAQGNYLQAQQHYEASLILRRVLDDRWGIAHSLSNLGSVAQELGDFARAIALQRESLALNRERGDKRGTAYTLHCLGSVATMQGDYEQALRYYEESLALRRELNDRWGIAYSLTNLGGIAIEQGNHVLATKLYAEGLALFRDLSDKQGIAIGLEGLAQVATMATCIATCESDSQVQAVRLFSAAATLREASGTPLPPSECQSKEHAMAVLREILGETAWAMAWADGQAFTVEHAISLALERSSALHCTQADMTSMQHRR